MLRRTRWIAIGAVVASAVAGGSVMLLQATGAESSFFPVTPTRVLDTRINVGLTGKLVHNTARLLTVTGSVPTTGGTMVVVPTGATAVVMNVTVVGPSAGGFVSVRPGDASGVPTTSNLNFAAGAVVPNAVTVELPVAGNLNLYYFGGTVGATTDLLIDIVGYYMVGSPGSAGLNGANGHSGPNFGRQVTYSTTPETGSKGGFPSLAIGSDGLPVIAHRDDTSTPSLRVTHCNDTACSSSTSLEVDAEDGWDLALAIGSDGLPIIAHQTNTQADLRMTHCNDVTCSSITQTTFLSPSNPDAIDPSIAIGTDGFAIVAHRDSTGGFRVTHCQDVACTTATTTPFGAGTSIGRDPSIAIGADGLPIIAHYDGTNQDLMVTHCANIACTSGATNAVDTVGNVGDESSIAIGTDGLAIISHRASSSADLRVSHCDNTNCTTATSTTVDTSLDFVGQGSSITIGLDGLPIIAHHDSSVGDLRLTHCSNIECSVATSQTVVSSEGDGQDPSIAIGRDSHIIIAHRSNTDGLRTTKIVHMSWTANSWES